MMKRRAGGMDRWVGSRKVSIVTGVVTDAAGREAVQSHRWAVVFFVQVNRHEQLSIEFLDAASSESTLRKVVAYASRTPAHKRKVRGHSPTSKHAHLHNSVGIC